MVYVHQRPDRDFGWRFGFRGRFSSLFEASDASPGLGTGGARAFLAHLVSAGEGIVQKGIACA